MTDLIGAVSDGLVGRITGPMAVRFLLQSAVAAFFGIRAGLKDGRTGKRPFLRRMGSEPSDRSGLMAERRNDVGILFLIATALDLVYQWTAFKEFGPVQAIAVAILLAIIPYSILRSLFGRLMPRPDMSPVEKPSPEISNKRKH